MWGHNHNIKAGENIIFCVAVYFTLVYMIYIYDATKRNNKLKVQTYFLYPNFLVLNSLAQYIIILNTVSPLFLETPWIIFCIGVRMQFFTVRSSLCLNECTIELLNLRYCQTVLTRT